MYRFAQKMTNRFKRKVHNRSKRNEPANRLNVQTINPMIPENQILPENIQPVEDIEPVKPVEENIVFNKNDMSILKHKIKSYKKYKQLDVKRNKKDTRILNYGISRREKIIYTTLTELNADIKNKSAVNFYRSYILGGTIIAVTSLISTALASTIILAPLAIVVGGISSKLNDYIQNKYLWVTNSKDSFSDTDLETFMNVTKLYYRILLSPFLNKVLKKHTLLFKYGNYASNIIKKNPGKHQEILAKNWDDEKEFDEEYNISGWVEHQIVYSVERLSNVIERIYTLDMVKDKIKFQELYNLFMSHFNQSKLLIDLYQTKYDVLEWRNDIETKEKQVAIDSTKHIIGEFDKIVHTSRINDWFSTKTSDSYKLNKTDLNKVLEVMK
jgi:hypothetical protein